jgi:hypothetical protein
MDSLVNDSLLAPCAVDPRPRYSRDGTRRCTETPHVSLLYLRCGVLFFRLKSAHPACGVAPGVGMRHGHANELQSTPCVTRDDEVFLREK